MNSSSAGKVFDTLETFRVEIPSWGFANTGTRFGKFLQFAAAATTEEKFSDAGEVHRVERVTKERAARNSQSVSSYA
jgi:L-rhamnose isomerase/sugar isomerase